MIDLKEKYQKQTQLAVGGLALVCASIVLNLYSVFGPSTNPFHQSKMAAFLPILITAAVILGKALCTQLAAYLGGGTEINKSLMMDILAVCLGLPVSFKMVDVFSAANGWLTLGASLCSLMGFLLFLSYLKETSINLEEEKLSVLAGKLISYFWLLVLMALAAILMIFIPVIGTLYIKLLWALLCAWGAGYLYLLGSLIKRLYQALS